MTNIDDIIWGDKTPFKRGDTILPLHKPLRLWWANGERTDYPAGHWDTQPSLLTHYAIGEPPKVTEVQALIARAVAEERERCAKVAEAHMSKIEINEPLWHEGQDWAAERIAEAIRSLK